ncbi:MAG: hypothetical protein C5B52_01775 [Bacteroidetes bacterium]|nr:MAG: hypothetical protein C5B52_01775 [Bacteroidota bacterium]
MKTKLNLLILFLLAMKGYSQAFFVPGNRGYLNLGIYSKKIFSPFSCNSNPAAWSQIENFSIGFAGEKNYLLDQLGTYNVYGSLHTNQLSIAISGNYLGFHNYNQTAFGLAFAKMLFRKLRIGLKVNQNGIHVPAYGNASAVNFELGFLADLNQTLRISWYAYNPLETHWQGGSGELIHAVYRMGLGYSVSNNLVAAFEFQKESFKALLVRTGINFRYSQKLTLGIAAELEPVSLSFGIGFQLGNLMLEVAVIYNQPLGYSPEILLSYLHPKNQNP